MGGYDDMAALERRGQLDRCWRTTPVTVRVAALQMNSGTEPEPNLDALEALAKEAAAAGRAAMRSAPKSPSSSPRTAKASRGVAGPCENNPDIARVSRHRPRHEALVCISARSR